MKCFLQYVFAVVVLVFYGLPGFAIQAVVNWNLFYSPGASGYKPYLELYWEINPASISWLKTNDSLAAKLVCKIQATVDTTIVFQDQYFLETDKLSDAKSIVAQHIAGQRRFFVQPGKMYLEVSLRDANMPEQVYNYQDSMTIHPVEGVALSGVQLIDTVILDARQSQYQKNDRQQIPLVNNYLPDGKKILHFYTEIYQPSADIKPLVLKTFISKKDSGPIYGLLRTDTLPAQLVQFFDGNFLPTKLPTGNYFLNAVLTDMSAQTIASQHTFFQIENKNPEKPHADTVKDNSTFDTTPTQFFDLGKTFVATYKPAQIRAILKMLLPIANATERNSINDFGRKPDDMYARYFIYNFWKQRDNKNPEAAWKAYAEKVKEVNKLFGNSSKPGYETERGFVYLQWGEPNERVPVENENGALPYEVWVYDYLPQQSGKGIYLFYRPAFMMGDYELLHSTVIGARKNLQWRSVLYPNGKRETDIRSRADDYLQNR